ncbi:hypothetical protein VitviT2T_007707 [Vitis vinifera]|uniref:NusB/RsmB/TIM44 domain-containing protein n=1 Tax=Vitis vinifera TaxID=29760 RepID=A0ABY9C153_VITVI|nr:hypothetical protein VitviT2T_007707 [Vitis vinifera]
MDANSLLCSSNSSKPHFIFNFNHSSSCQFLTPLPTKLLINSKLLSSPRTSLRTSALTVEKPLDKPSEPREMLPRIDKSGRFCSPRAARELALLIAYAACLEGSDPVRLFERRMNARREPGYEFDKDSLLEYNHMSFGGPPVTTETVEEADELLRNNEKESAIEAEVLSAPPKLVYGKLILRFTRKLLVAVVDKWNSHVLVIDKVAPPNWKNEPAGRILELCILHLAMSEIAVLGTRHQIVINEAVDLAKRFCDGAAPRIINGCLRTFVKDLEGTGITRASETTQEVEGKLERVSCESFLFSSLPNPNSNPRGTAGV